MYPSSQQPYGAMQSESAQSMDWAEWLRSGSKIAFLNTLNFSERLTTVIQASVLTALAVRVFYQSNNYGGVNADYWDAPDTIIYTLVTLLAGLGIPIIQLFSAKASEKNEKASVVKEAIDTMGGIGLISYLSRTYQVPTVVKYALITATSIPFIILLFSVLGEKITAEKVRKYVKKVASWVEKRPWVQIGSKIWVDGANAAQGVAALISSMIDYWYDASHENNYSGTPSEKQWVLIGLIIGFFVGSVGSYIFETGGYSVFKKFGKFLDEFGVRVFCCVNYLVLLTAARNPATFVATGFDAERSKLDSIMGWLMAASAGGAIVVAAASRLTDKLPPYPTKAQVRAEPLLAFYWFMCFVMAIAGTVFFFPDVVRQPLAALWQKWRSPEEHRVRSELPVTSSTSIELHARLLPAADD